MSFLSRILNKGAVSVAFGAIMAVVPISAHAVTVLDDGDSINVTTGEEFLWSIDGTGAAGSETVTFNSLVDPLGSTAVATIGPITLSAFDPVSIAWFSLGFDGILGGGDDFLVASAPVTVPSTSLATTFASPDRLVQQLIVSFGQSQDNTSFDVEVSTVPLPAGGLLLLTALGGVAVLRRKRKTA